MATKLVEAIGDNKELKDKFLNAESDTAAYDLIKDKIPGYTYDDFKAELKTLSDSRDGSISDEELDAVAGGYREVSNKEFVESLFSYGKWIAKLFG
jgi:hypothetical protein